jgi:hypothetical protein
LRRVGVEVAQWWYNVSFVLFVLLCRGNIGRKIV